MNTFPKLLLCALALLCAALTRAAGRSPLPSTPTAWMQTKPEQDKKPKADIKAKPPKVDVKVKPPKAPKVDDKLQPPKKNLIKTVLGLLKFKANADRKFNGRVVNVITDLGLKDSIAATAENVRLLSEQLTKINDLDSLKTAIRALAQRQAQMEIDNASRNTLPDNQPASPVDLEALAEQLAPLLASKAAVEASDKERAETLRNIRQVQNSDTFQVHQIKLEDSTTRSFRLAVRTRADAYGFFDASYKVNAPPFFSPSRPLVYYALPVNETTGGFDNLNGWDNTPVVDDAHKKGAPVYFSVLIANPTGKAPLLYSQAARENCINNILILLKMRKAAGVNISFKNLGGKDRAVFTSFISLLSRALHIDNAAYKLFVTVPRIDEAQAYDIGALEPLTDLFFIDCATALGRCGPLAALNGKSGPTVERSFLWYADRGLPAGRAVLILPYRGVRCPGGTDGYMPYRALSNATDAIFDEDATTMYLDSLYPNKRIYRVWFDDETTLSKKFDYLASNGVGIGVYFINYDGAYGELTNELVYRTNYIDTTYINTDRAPAERLTFFGKAHHYLSLWSYILENPCTTCFEDSSVPMKEKIRIREYLSELRIDSLIIAERLSRAVPDTSSTVTIKDQFNYVNNQLNWLMKYVVLFFLLVSCGMATVYVYGTKYNGSDWGHKKLVAGILVGLVFLLVFFTFMYCFTSDAIPMFGASAASARSPACTVDPTCVNIPFSTLLAIIFVGVGLGLLIFRYLVTPLVKRNDIP